MHIVLLLDIFHLTLYLGDVSISHLEGLSFLFTVVYNSTKWMNKAALPPPQ